jgi:enoyl-[acyl-carrier protein] reductase II
MTARPAPAPVRTRVSDLLGIEYPIVQAPMGYIARAQLASAVSNAGGLGIIAQMADRTDRPFGVNVAQLFVRDAAIVDFLVDNGVRFVTTSAGDPTLFTKALKDAGLTVFHVVPSLRAALKAVDAGVDGLVVEGGEGGGFKAQRDVSTMVLLPLVCSKVDVPVIAAGGICDGRSMAAAFALGAEAVQMGTRMVSAAESPVHQNWKDLIVATPETGTIMLNRFHKPGFRVLATPLAERLEQSTERVTMGDPGRITDWYFGGDAEAMFAFGGQVAGRIEDVRPVRDILWDTIDEFRSVMATLGARFA